MRQKGQTLLEILFAFGVSIMGMSATILSVTTALNNIQYAKNQSLANLSAQEGMAVIRQIRDSNWNYFSTRLTDFSSGLKYCIDENLVLKGPISSAGYCFGDNAVGEKGNFSREVEFEHSSDACATNCPGAGCVKGSKVTVTVSWSDNKCSVGAPRCHKVELITCFSNTSV